MLERSEKNWLDYSKAEYFSENLRIRTWAERSYTPLTQPLYGILHRRNEYFYDIFLAFFSNINAWQFSSSGQHFCVIIWAITNSYFTLHLTHATTNNPDHPFYMKTSSSFRLLGFVPSSNVTIFLVFFNFSSRGVMSAPLLISSKSLDAKCGSIVRKSRSLRSSALRAALKRNSLELESRLLVGSADILPEATPPEEMGGAPEFGLRPMEANVSPILSRWLFLGRLELWLCTVILPAVCNAGAWMWGCGLRLRLGETTGGRGPWLRRLSDILLIAETQSQSLPIILDRWKNSSHITYCCCGGSYDAPGRRGIAWRGRSSRRMRPCGRGRNGIVIEWTFPGIIDQFKGKLLMT